MIITFPHFGNSCFAVKAILDGLKVEYIMPEIPNKSCLELGTLYAPEEICLPFKIMVGSFIKSIEKGADTILIVGSCGPCRFGEYGELLKIIFDRLGYKLDYIILDQPGEIGIKELLNRFGKISTNSTKSKSERFIIAKNAYKVISLMDSIEEKLRYKAGFEKNQGQCKALLNDCKMKAYNCHSDIEMVEHLTKNSSLIDNIEIDENSNPLRIALIGEIYTIMEPFSNFYIEDKLMDLGISTRKLLSASWWLKDAFSGILGLNSLDIKRASKQYIPLQIGGYARECIGEAVLAAEENFDGAIQVFPMGCMPEIVSKSILPKVSKDKNFPILSMVVDEMTGEAGFVTRLEAFVDLLERSKDNVLYGS